MVKYGRKKKRSLESSFEGVGVGLQHLRGLFYSVLLSFESGKEDLERLNGVNMIETSFNEDAGFGANATDAGPQDTPFFDCAEEPADNGAQFLWYPPTQPTAGFAAEVVYWGAGFVAYGP